MMDSISSTMLFPVVTSQKNIGNHSQIIGNHGQRPEITAECGRNGVSFVSSKSSNLSYTHHMSYLAIIHCAAGNILRFLLTGHFVWWNMKFLWHEYFCLTPVLHDATYKLISVKVLISSWIFMFSFNLSKCQMLMLLPGAIRKIDCDNWCFFVHFWVISEHICRIMNQKWWKIYCFYTGLRNYLWYQAMLVSIEMGWRPNRLLHTGFTIDWNQVIWKFYRQLGL